MFFHILKIEGFALIPSGGRDPPQPPQEIPKPTGCRTTHRPEVRTGGIGSQHDARQNAVIYMQDANISVYVITTRHYQKTNSYERELCFWTTTRKPPRTAAHVIITSSTWSIITIRGGAELWRTRERRKRAWFPLPNWGVIGNEQKNHISSDGISITHISINSSCKRNRIYTYNHMHQRRQKCNRSNRWRINTKMLFWIWSSKSTGRIHHRAHSKRQSFKHD